MCSAGTEACMRGGLTGAWPTGKCGGAREADAGRGCDWGSSGGLILTNSFISARSGGGFKDGNSSDPSGAQQKLEWIEGPKSPRTCAADCRERSLTVQAATAASGVRERLDEGSAQARQSDDAEDEQSADRNAGVDGGGGTAVGGRRANAWMQMGAVGQTGRGGGAVCESHADELCTLGRREADAPGGRADAGELRRANNSQVGARP